MFLIITAIALVISIGAIVNGIQSSGEARIEWLCAAAVFGVPALFVMWLVLSA